MLDGGKGSGGPGSSTTPTSSSPTGAEPQQQLGVLCLFEVTTRSEEVGQDSEICCWCSLQKSYRKARMEDLFHLLVYIVHVAWDST